MKKFIPILLLAMCSSAYSNCYITSYKDNDLTEIINENDGWDLKDFDTLCQKLKRYNLGVHLSQIEMISKYQTSVATAAHVYPLDLDQKYDQMLLASTGIHSITTHPERTSATVKELKYSDANNALNRLNNDKEAWLEMIDQVAVIRKLVK